MRPDPKLFDDIARVAGGAVNIVSGLQQQIRDDIRVRLDEMAARMDLVPREDLDRALETVAGLRKRVDALEERLSKLEKGASGSGKAEKAKADKAPAKTGRRRKKS